MDQAEHIFDQLADEFEAAWKSGNRPELSEYLFRVDEAAQAPLLRMLIPIDAEHRHRRRENVSAATYEELGSNFQEAIEAGIQSFQEDHPAVEDRSIERFQRYSRITKVGPYVLQQRLGTGGMGEVWIAEQSEPVKRQVALKLIKGGVGSKEIIARFEAERQALALMNHPNIARILDAGTTPSGQPYFVMELVNGKPLTNYCDENCLGIEQRLKLFLDVCSGIQHAHQKGIIHRDLKPSNIIVGMQDGQPVAKIIDFGLAKALENTQRLTDQSLFTGIGQILGTLKYMSPEQATLDLVDVDTRTDIYALGVE